MTPFEEIEDIPPIIYKYRDWQDDYHKKIITDYQVFFAEPKSFKDPEDCKNSIRYDLLSTREIYEKYLTESYKINRNFKRKQHKGWAVRMYKQSPLRNKKHIKAHQEQTFNDFNERFGVLSLTANPTNLKMWEDYSNNHTGFCIGFDSLIMFPYLGGGGPVNYVKSLPIIYPTPKHTFEEQHALLVFSKLEKWQYEQEYRTHKFHINPLSLEDRQVSLPPESYKELIFGANMTEDIIQDVKSNIPDNLQHMDLKRARFQENEVLVEEYE